MHGFYRLMTNKDKAIMKLNAILYFIFIFLLSNSTLATERNYRAHIETAKWTAEAKEQYFCKIKQKIPYYGEAIFTRKSGNEMLFELKSHKLFMQNTQVTIIAEPAPWRSSTQSFEIGSFTLQQGHKPLTVKHPYAYRMFQQLENGMMPTISYHDIADQRDAIVVAISPMKFRKKLSKFLLCESSLLEYDPDFIKDFDIFFTINKANLTVRAKKNLAYAVKHLSVDKNIKQIRVDAHADNIGRRRFNDKLSTRRAEAVKKYLIEAGASENIIVIKAHGEREPKFSNDDKQGRAKNRHAQIQLLNTLPAIEEDSKGEEEGDFVPSDKLNTPVPNFINLEHLIPR